VRRHRTRYLSSRWALGLGTSAIAGIPAALTVLLVHARFGVGTGAFVPNVWNDQVAYWHKIAGFAKVGFGTGYYSPNEIPPPVHAIRFGVNGPWFPMIYGSVGMVLGWSSSTSIAVNMAVVALGFIVFARLAALDLARTALAGATVVACWPVLEYIPTASQESLDQAIAMVLAGFFVRAVRRGPDVSRAEKLSALGFLIAVSIFRYSWALLVPVLVLLWAKPVTPRRFTIAVSGSVILLGASLRITSLLQPAGINAGIDALNGFSANPAHGGVEIIRTALGDLKTFLAPGVLDPVAVPIQTGVQDWMIVAICLLALASLVAPGRLLRWPSAVLNGREAAVHLVNLGVTTLAALALYLPFGYYRVLGAHLLLSLLVLVGCRRTRILAVALAINIALVGAFMQSYGRWAPDFQLDQHMLKADRAAFARLLVYTRAGGNPWCNTLTLPVALLDWRATLVPPGIGISYELAPTVPARPKARYVLLRRAVPHAHFVKLGSFAAGTLYENRASLCRLGG
jgi:hypothetical protein